MMPYPQNNIVDSFGRVHNYLRISLTERCNLRCFYCMPEEGIPLRDKENFMTAEETLAIAKTFVNMGVNKIRLTGGEPLIKKNIAIILEELAQLPVELAITTNGILVNQYIDLFEKINLRSINVSLDTLQKDRFENITRRNYFDRVLSNIFLLEERGFKPKINVVVMRGVNDDEITDFVKLTKDHAVEVRFIEFMPFDGNKWNWEKKVSQEEILTRIYQTFSFDDVTPYINKPHDTARVFNIKNFKGKFGIISSVTNPFCDTCNRIRLTADGKIKNCLFSQSETDLLTAYRQGNDIQSLILESIHNKKKARGGIVSFENPEDVQAAFKNRTMTSIGG